MNFISPGLSVFMQNLINDKLLHFYGLFDKNDYEKYKKKKK